MTITLTAGSWLMPVGITLLSVGYTLDMIRAAGMDRTIILGLWLAAFMISVASWCIWLEYA